MNSPPRSGCMGLAGAVAGAVGNFAKPSLVHVAKVSKAEPAVDCHTAVCTAGTACGTLPALFSEVASA